MSLPHDTARAFEPDGCISESMPHFVARSGQLEMARQVALAIESNRHLVVEAGTGVGKTFAYLVPSILSGKRTLVSTATKALQDQLFLRDLPQVVKALGVPIQLAMLKGRSSYLCLHRLDLAQNQASGQHGQTAALSRIQQWAKVTFTGDLAELKGLDENSPLRPFITSSRENCLGSECPSAKHCHVNLARKEAMAADLVVVNHHLFFADMVVRESGVAQLLPSMDVVILDEAHHLNDTGIGFLSKGISSSQILDLSRDALTAGLAHAKGLVDWVAVSQALEQCIKNMRLAVGKPVEGKRIRWEDRIPEGMDGDQWGHVFKDFFDALNQMDDALALVEETHTEFERLQERVAHFHALFQHFQKSADSAASPRVRWVEVGSQWRLVEAPLDIAQTMQSALLVSHDMPQDDEHNRADSKAQELATAGQKTWIFTSATLGGAQDLAWFAKPLGLLSDAPTAQPLPVDFACIASPYDYAVQAAIHVPQSLPKPSDPGHSMAVADLAQGIVDRLQGRTLLLTTSLRALSVIGQALQSRVWAQDTLILVQGQSSKADLIERFVAAHHRQQAAVLVASVSFWEGIDVAGDALQCVIIDKLPFPAPGDPLMEARSKQIESQGGSAFQMLSLPEAAIALKQGTGRLIRRETDRGLLVVCDSRLTQMSYGRSLLKSLPTMPLLMTQAQCDAYLDHLAASRLPG